MRHLTMRACVFLKEPFLTSSRSTKGCSPNTSRYRSTPVKTIPTLQLLCWIHLHLLRCACVQRQTCGPGKLDSKRRNRMQLGSYLQTRYQLLAHCNIRPPEVFLELCTLTKQTRLGNTSVHHLYLAASLLVKARQAGKTSRDVLLGSKVEITWRAYVLGVHHAVRRALGDPASF